VALSVLVRAGLVAVAHAGLGDQPARPRRVGFELAAQLSHVQAEVAGGVGVSGSPHLGQQLVAAEQLTGVAKQHLEQVPLGGGEPDVVRLSGPRRAAPVRHRGLPGDPLGGQVHDQAAKPDPGLVIGCPGTPDRGPHAGEKFLHPERLGDVVVRAGVERLDLVGAVGSPGQHDDGRLGPAAQALDHLHAFQIGQAEVEDHQVRRMPGGDLERFGPGGRHVHPVFAHPQVDAQRTEDLRLVVDDQHPGHGPASSAASRSRWPGSYS
jgi:hypothetical protein